MIPAKVKNAASSFSERDTGRGVSQALALTVALVLADSSVVVLALPEIYRELDVSVTAVTWVLVGFNLVLALAALPAAAVARRLGPARVTLGGLALFAAASLACGIAESIAVLIAARCVQAVGGAAAVCAALELLPAATGSERRAAGTWAAAGALGAALGPGVGGLLTELISWQSIFLAQLPLATAAAMPLLAPARLEGSPRRRASELRAAGGPHLGANLALALLSAALAAALFLVVLLLIEGWRLTPIAAAATVSVMPLAAVLGSRVSTVASGAARAGAGAILIAGGLAAFALLPSATVAATLAPQALIGIGLALALSALTETALAGRAPQAIHGGWTIASRHAGVVAGLLVLTPVFTADLQTQRADAELAGVAALLDSPLDPSQKLALAERIGARVEAEGEKVPILDPAFEPLPDDDADRAAALDLRDELADELDRGATHAFSRSFWVAAAFALAALAPIALARRRPSL